MANTLSVKQVRVPGSKKKSALDLIRHLVANPPLGYEYQSREMLSKYVDDRSPDASRKALVKWLEVDDRLSASRVSFIQRYASSSLFASVIDRSKEMIRRTLGPFNVQELLKLSKFGPGASMLVRGLDTNAYRKFASAEVTSDFRTLASNLITALPSWSNSLGADGLSCPLLRVCNEGRLQFVPKTTEVDRPIVVEPSVNSFFQLGIGRMMRRRTERRFSCDLSDQTLNQRLARFGSATNSLCTIDLSSASDTVSHWLVRELLPDDWFYWLEITRTKWIILPDGSRYFPKKFSSMGNGYTWDLESLIFYTLTYVTCELCGFNTFWVACFGDDIIAPSGLYAELRSVLEGCGFIVNEKKSFVNSAFRESCGKDYIKGIDVRPVFLRRLDTYFDLIDFSNRLRQNLGSHQSFRRLSDELLRLVPPYLRSLSAPMVGEDGQHFSSTAVTRPFDECCPVSAKSRYPGWEGWLYRHYVPIVRKKRITSPFYLTHVLHESHMRGVVDIFRAGSSPVCRGGIAPIKELIGYKLTQSVTRSW